MAELYWAEAMARDMRGVNLMSMWAGQQFDPIAHMYETRHLLPGPSRKLTQREVDDLERGIIPEWLASENYK